MQLVSLCVQGQHFIAERQLQYIVSTPCFDSISEIIMKMIVLFDDSNQDCVINGGRDCNGRSAFVRQFHSSLMSIPVLSGCLNKMG